jgi:chromosome segregation ATPase
MEPLIQSLEKSLGKSKAKLKEESRLRKQLEEEREQWGGRHRVADSSRDATDSLREDHGVLRQEVGNRSQWEVFNSSLGSASDKRENRLGDRSTLTDDAMRSDIDTISASNITKDTTNLDDSYLEVLDELETVTEQLISTQQNLWNTEDKLRDSEARVQEFEDQQTVTSADKILRAKIEALEHELASAHEQVSFANEVAQAEDKKDNIVTFHLQNQLQSQFDEMEEENTLLLQKVAALQQQLATETTRVRTYIMKEASEERDHALILLRGQFEEIFKQNGGLQERIVKLEGENDRDSAANSEEMFELKEEIERLQFEFSAATDQNRIYLLENDASWREKLERVREDSMSNFLAMQMTSDGKDEIVEGLQQQIQALCRERDSLETKVADLESSSTRTEGNKNRNSIFIEELQEQMRIAQCSNSSLEQKVDELTANIQSSSTVIEKLETGRAEIVAELESASPLIDDLLGVEGGSPPPDGCVNLKDTIHKLCSYLKTAKKGGEENPADLDTSYLNERITQLELELETSRDNFVHLSEQLEVEKTKEAAAAKSESMIKILRKELAECQAALELSPIENKKLEIDSITTKTQQEKQERANIHRTLMGHSQNPRARDPEPDQTSFDEANRLQNLQRNPSTPPFPTADYRKDPPSSKKKPHKNFLLSFVDGEADVQTLWCRLEEVALENKVLKEKIKEQCAAKVDTATERNRSLKAMQEQINALKSSYNKGNVEKELEDMKQLLQKKSTELKDCEEVMLRSKAEVDTLRGEMIHLSEVLETEKKSQARIKKEFETAIIRKVTEEKSSLRHQLDETKKALSVTQSDLDQRIEDVNACEARLATSQGEIHVLDRAIADLDCALSQLRKDYDSALKHAEEREQSNRSEIYGFANELKKLADDNNTLHRENEEKSQQIHLLTKEICNLSSALEVAKGKYNGAVDELEAVVNDQFEEARREAEKSGRESAAEELRAEMRARQEKERKHIHDKVDDAFKENSRLLRELVEAKRSSSTALNSQNEKLAESQNEAELLKQVLETSTKEIKEFKEREYHLKTNLEEIKEELRITKEEREIASSSLNRFREDLEQQKASPSIGASTPVAQNASHKILRDQMRDMISRLGVGSEPSCTRKAEELQLKVELLDISMTLGKIVRENAILEEELKNVKKNLNETRISAEAKGRREATRKVWAEIKESREREMREFKEQFNSLVQENADTEKKMKECNIALTIAKDTRDRAERELEHVQEEAESSKLEARESEQGILKLNLEMEAVRDEQERAVDEVKSAMRKEGEARVMALNQEICNLTDENSALRHNLGRSRKEETVAKQELQVLMTSLNKSHRTMEEIKDERDRFGEKVQAVESASEQVTNELKCKLLSASEELAELSSKVLSLNSALDERTRELLYMQRKYGRESKHWNANDSPAVKELQKEKSLLEKQVDEAQIALSLSKCEQEELKQCNVALQSSKEASENHHVALRYVNEELAKAKEENAETIKALAVINQLLDSIEGVNDKEELSPAGKLTTSNQMARGIRKKLATLISILQDVKNESGSKEQQQQQNKELHKLQTQLQISDMKYDQSRKEASQWQGQVTRLLEELDNAKHEQATLRMEMENLNSRIVDMCMEAEERGKEIASREIQNACKEVLPDSQGFFYQKTALQQQEMAKEFSQANRQMISELGSLAMGKARCTLDSDILSELPSMDEDMEETDHISNLQAELQHLQQQFENLPDHSEILEGMFESQERQGNEISESTKPQSLQLSEYGLMLDSTNYDA